MTEIKRVVYSDSHNRTHETVSHSGVSLVTHQLQRSTNREPVLSFYLQTNHEVQEKRRLTDPEVQELSLDLTDYCEGRSEIVIPLKVTRLMRQATALVFTYYVKKTKNYAVDEVLSKLVEQVIKVNEEMLCSAFSYVMVIRYIKKHVYQTLAINDFCLALHMSPTTLQRVCQQYTGKSVIRLFMEYKCWEAERLLVETTLPVQEISEKLGFKNSKHFSTFFKRHTGSTPLKVRKEKGSRNNEGE